MWAAASSEPLDEPSGKAEAARKQIFQTHEPGDLPERRVLELREESLMANATSGPRATDPSPRPIDRVSRYLEKLASAGFFGRVVVTFQHGKVCDLRIEETKKLEEL
jgi:hypothetical protein